MQASIDSLDTSLQATLAPYLASARATPLPMLGPTPVTSATLPSRDTSTVHCSVPVHLSGARPSGPCRLCGAGRLKTSAVRTEEASQRLGLRPTASPLRRGPVACRAPPSSPTEAEG